MRNVNFCTYASTMEYNIVKMETPTLLQSVLDYPPEEKEPRRDVSEMLVEMGRSMLSKQQEPARTSPRF
uniref:Uncharacterized protein n=1 Tax=Arundo donax TaxID=35708 RepID=A0A0A9GVQ7_ARUDO